MKKLATILLLLIPGIALAQEGTVLYEQTVKMEITLPPEMEHMKDQFPSTRTTSKLLYFNEASSLMKDAPQEEGQEDEIASDSDGIRFRMRMDNPDEATYTNFDEETTIEKRDFMGRTFLITGEPASLQWRLTGEQSEFLGYMCQKATAMRDSVAVEAWFTPEIPVPAGPAMYGGLPGLILVLTEDEGRRSFVAKEVSLEALAENTVVPPDDGRKVTREEFDGIVEEKMKEMGAERGASGTVIIRRQN